MRLKTLNDLELFHIISFTPGIIPEEELMDDKGKIVVKKRQEPSEFSGESLSQETSGNLVDSEKLKQELIKWVKELEKPTGNSTHGECCTCSKCRNNYDDCDCEIRQAKKEVIMEFGDITDEDLK
jgi:hypothetical protein